MADWRALAQLEDRVAALEKIHRPTEHTVREEAP
jgi:hypothetical protein